MSLVKFDREQRLYNFYKKFLDNPHLIDKVVIESFKEDLELLNNYKKHKKII
ncbi:hypothetical protein EV143_1266 [Flavobacterium chryseum]|nr:hypothetical protein EV143_1266 [Flavobacterium sp. P3160]